MSRAVSGLFGSKQKSPPSAALRISTSIYGTPIPLILGGQSRMPVNLIDYFDLEWLDNGNGGKGGNNGKGSGGYNYYVDMLMAVCEGPILTVFGNYLNGNFDEFEVYGQEFNFLGDYQQQPWDFVKFVHPERALAYRGIHYIGTPQYFIGTSVNVPQVNIGVVSTNSSNIVPGQPDGDPTIAFLSFLTDPHWGLGFPAARIGALSGSPGSWQSYCRALGFGVSPIMTAATQAASFLGDLCDATNSAPCWQNGQMTVVPYGDTAISQGALTTITETHIVPPITGLNLAAPIIVGNVGNFVSDGGVTYTNGTPFTLVPFPPGGSGTYSQSNGTYYFTSSDINQNIYITYTYAAASSYVPQTQSLYDFTVNDFLTNQGSIGSGLAPGNSPVTIVRKSRDQMLNSVKVEYLDRNNAYNPVTLEVKDSASIYTYGRLRPSDMKQMHFFCLASAAVQACTLQLVRQQVARTYQWTVGKHFTMILELMNIVTLTLPSMGLSRQPVRIIELQENTDQTLTITGEDFNGTASAPVYGTEAAVGQQPAFNLTPGSVNVPLLFEPTDELGTALNPGGGLMVAAALSGMNMNAWGGCQVFLSYDDNQYAKIGTINAAARMGVLTAPLPGVTPSITGQTIDAVNTLSVDLTQSKGTLTSVSQIDATSLNTRSFVGPLIGQAGAGTGEVISYQNATLLQTSEYGLTYLVRGAYGTEAQIQTWPVGTGFARLDDRIFVLPFDQGRIGSVIFLKFLSFNIYGGGLESLADVPAYSYTLQGLALASPLPDLTNLRAAFQAGRLAASWDDITDFRSGIRVEIRQGPSFNSAVILGTVAHPPYVFPGDGTYWFTGWCQPAANLVVRSEVPMSMSVSGTTAQSNVVTSYDIGAHGWPGTFANTTFDGTGVRIPGGQLSTSGTTLSGNTLVFNSVPTADVLPGMLVTDLTNPLAIPPNTYIAAVTTTQIFLTRPVVAFGGFGTGVQLGDVIQIGTAVLLNLSGTYTPSLVVNVGRVTNMTLTLSTSVSSSAVQNILTDPNILGLPDVLGAAGAQYVDVHALVSISQDGVTYAAPIKYVPGDYFGMAAKFQFVLSTTDKNTTPYLLSAVATAQVPARRDHILTNATLSSGGSTVTFTPDGSLTAAAFNGGPNGATSPAIIATWGDEQAGDVFVVTGLTLSVGTFQIKNGGVGVTRNQVTIIAEGF